MIEDGCATRIVPREDEDGVGIGYRKFCHHWWWVTDFEGYICSRKGTVCVSGIESVLDYNGRLRWSLKGCCATTALPLGVLYQSRKDVQPLLERICPRASRAFQQLCPNCGGY